MSQMGLAHKDTEHRAKPKSYASEAYPKPHPTQPLCQHMANGYFRWFKTFELKEVCYKGN